MIVHFDEIEDTCSEEKVLSFSSFPSGEKSSKRSRANGGAPREGRYHWCIDDVLFGNLSQPDAEPDGHSGNEGDGETTLKKKTIPISEDGQTCRHYSTTSTAITNQEQRERINQAPHITTPNLTTNFTINFESKSRTKFKVKSTLTLQQSHTPASKSGCTALSSPTSRRSRPISTTTPTTTPGCP